MLILIVLAGLGQFQSAVMAKPQQLVKYNTMTTPVVAHCKFINTSNKAMVWELAHATLSIQADLSNSACPGHGRPLQLDLNTVWNETITAHTDMNGKRPEGWRAQAGMHSNITCQVDIFSQAEKSKVVQPGQSIWVEVWITHLHGNYTWYEPLWGKLHLELSWDDNQLSSTVLLEPIRVPGPMVVGATRIIDCNTFPSDGYGIICTDFYRSKPNSYRLSTGRNKWSLKFDDLYTRPGARVRVEFWYLTAVGSEIHPQVSIKQVTNSYNNLQYGKTENFTLPWASWWTKWSQEFTMDPGMNCIFTEVLIPAGETMVPPLVSDVYVDDVLIRSSVSRPEKSVPLP